MKRVTGIGGLLFKCDDPQNLKAWYGRHLGLPVDEWGATFLWRTMEDPQQVGRTQWGSLPKATDYFEPSKKEFMINYRVADLEALLAALKEEGVQIVGEMQEFEYGKFAWIMDPEGNKIELWEAPEERS